MKKLSVTTDLSSGETIYFEMNEANRFHIYVETGDLWPQASMTFNDWAVAHRTYEELILEHKYRTTEYTALHNEFLENGGPARF